MKATVDLVDIVGLYLVIQRIGGKGQVKVLASGLGWAFAELLLTRIIFLWVGARGIEFDWKYIQNSFDANISLVSPDSFEMTATKSMHYVVLLGSLSDLSVSGLVGGSSGCQSDSKSRVGYSHGHVDL